jgi:hypothetical protein
MDPKSQDQAASPAGSPAKARAAAESPIDGTQPGLFERIFGSLFTSDDPEKQKQKLLKQLAKDLKKARPRFYNPLQGLAEPALARFFYEFYKAFAPAQVLLRGARQSGVLKSVLVETTLSKVQAEIRDRLSEKSIEERARTADPAALMEQVKEDARLFIQSFDVSAINDIDASYNRLAVLLDLIDFDYYFFLRKFDSAFPEKDFTYKPRFETINCEYVSDELKDFLEILPAFDPEADWEQLLRILKEYRGVDVVAKEAMRKVTQLLRDTQRSGALLAVVRHSDKDPFYKPLMRVHRERIVEPFITKIKGQAELTAQKLVQSRKNEKLEQLTRAVFGTASVSRLANYSEKTNMSFAKKMLGGFVHVQTLNFLKAFLLDYFKKNIREIVDLLLIKGKWGDNQPSQTVSEAYHQLLKISEAVTRFDESLGEDGELGRKVKAVMSKADRDKKAITNLRAVLQEVNDEAGTMLTEAVGHFVSIAKILKLVYDDCGKAHPELIINWRELKSLTDKDIRALVASVYKQIYNFVQLIQSYR